MTPTQVIEELDAILTDPRYAPPELCLRDGEWDPTGMCARCRIEALRDRLAAEAEGAAA